MRCDDPLDNGEEQRRATERVTTIGRTALGVQRLCFEEPRWTPTRRLLRSFSSSRRIAERVVAMSIVEWDPLSSNEVSPPEHRPSSNDQRPLHRLAEVRRQQGISQRNMARRLNVDVATLRQQEAENADLPLSVVYQWQRVLEVPIAELLVDSDAPLSPPVFERARMVKVMKTVAAISEKADSPSLKRLMQMLCDQLLEIMPELTDVAPWHTVGQRRTLDEYGRTVERQMPDSMFQRHGK